jgi:hypothetical protein
MTIQQIESAILELPPSEFRKVIDWLLDLDYQRWDFDFMFNIEGSDGFG